jgi:hypothetical protein
MNTNAYKNTLQTVTQIKQWVANFEMFLNKAIGESEDEMLYSSEACNNPDNRVCRKCATAKDIYHSCIEFIDNNDRTAAACVLKILMENLQENLKTEERKSIEDVLRYAQSKGFQVAQGISEAGDEIVVLFNS